MRELLIKLAAKCESKESRGRDSTASTTAPALLGANAGGMVGKRIASKTKQSSAALGGGLGALLAGAPGAAVGGAIGAKENHRGHAAVSSGLGSLGASALGGLTLGGLAALLTRSKGGFRSYFSPYSGRHYLHYVGPSSDAGATALAGLLGASAGSIAGGALGGHYSDKKYGKKR